MVFNKVLSNKVLVASYLITISVVINAYFLSSMRSLLSTLDTIDFLCLVDSSFCSNERSIFKVYKGSFTDLI